MLLSASRNWTILAAPECGKNDMETPTHVSGSINDGEKFPVGAWPWMASLGFAHEEQSWTHRCGATLISDQHFLTAAHCIRAKWGHRFESYFDLRIHIYGEIAQINYLQLIIITCFMFQLSLSLWKDQLRKQSELSSALLAKNSARAIIQW